MGDTGVVLIVFWVVVVNPLVGYAIGERKGNVATGIILGLLLGPIGWLVTAMCFSNLRKCPFCSEDIKPDAKVCRYCGRDLPPTQRQARRRSDFRHAAIRSAVVRRTECERGSHPEE